MPSPKTVIEASGREVAISNPDKVFFPRTGHTKMDLIRYYLAVADGALGGAGCADLSPVSVELAKKRIPSRGMSAANPAGK